MSRNLETLNPNLETRNPNLETRNTNLVTRNPNLETRNTRLETRNLKKQKMKDFKPGDKVRFLNTTGGGTIVKQINSYMMLVQIEDGFEVPTLMSEIIKISDEKGAGKLFIKKDELIPTKINENHDVLSENASQNVFEDNSIVDLSSSEKIESGIYIGWFPIDNQKVIISNKEALILNCTDVEILFSIHLKGKEKTFKGFDYGSLAPQTGIILSHVSPADMLNWKEGNVQILFFQEKTKNIPLPVSAFYNLSNDEINNEDSYIQFLPYSNKTGMVKLLTSFPEKNVSDYNKQLLLSKYGKEIETKKAETIQKKSKIFKYQIEKQVAEIDLHISALLDNYTKMSAHEILNYQLRHFDKMLDEAVINGFRKLIVIHGIGNGILKNAITNRVSQDESIQIQDASFAKYGYGAIELILNY